MGLHINESGVLDSVVFPCGTASYEVDFKSVLGVSGFVVDLPHRRSIC